MLREETLWSITVAYWCCAISAAVVKICVPSVDDLLRYGLRRQQHRHKHRTKKDSVKSTSELSIPFFLRLLLDPIHGIPPLACWASFYAFAFANSCVLYAYYYHYHYHNQDGMQFRHPVIAMFALHVMRRFLEVLYLQKLSPKPRISLSHFLMGISFYVFAPYTIIRASCAEMSASSLSAIFLFLSSQIFQHLKHRALVNVRPPLVRRKYGIPSGFDVACPHYSAEIFTYVLFCTLAPSVPGILMVCFVLLNLGHSASQTLAWYHQTFLKKVQFKYALFKYVF